MPHNILRDDLEYIVHCDEQGKVIGPISKEHAHMKGVRDVLAHWSTWSMIYYPREGKYGIQQKNPNKFEKHSAGKWDMGVAGHNCYFKEGKQYRILDFDENLIKEAKEEIGLDIEMCTTKEKFLEISNDGLDKSVGFIFDQFHYKTNVANEWIGFGFVVVSNTDVTFEDDEVVDFKWLTPGELKDYLMNNNDYCYPLPLAFEKAEQFRKENSL